MWRLHYNTFLKAVCPTWKKRIEKHVNLENVELLPLLVLPVGRVVWSVLGPSCACFTIFQPLSLPLFERLFIPHMLSWEKLQYMWNAMVESVEVNEEQSI